MKIKFFTLVFLLAISFSVSAQDTSKAEDRIEANTARLTKLMKLDDAQQVQVRAIFSTYSADMTAMKASSLSGKEAKTQKRSMVYDRRMAILDVLNDEQKKRMKQYNRRLEKSNKRLKKTAKQN